MGPTLRSWLTRLGALTLVLVLASCYVPDRFRSELRLSRYGDWALSYDGDLAYVPILHDYAEGKVKPEDDAARQENIRKDLARDQAFKKIEPRGKGRFTVHYQREGRLDKVQLVALIRRDSRIISMKSRDNNTIVIAANGIKPSDAQAMMRGGVEMKGEFRVTTDANIIQHNATEVRSFGAYTVYVWRMENALSPPPRLVMVRDPDPQRPLK